MLSIYDLKTEHLKNPMGIDAKNPRFTWKLKSKQNGMKQHSYRMVVSEGDKLLWDTGVTESDETFVKYSGLPLESRMKLSVNLNVTSRAGSQMETASAEGTFEMGLLNEQDWCGKWITPEENFDMFLKQPAPYLRKKFFVKKGLKSARAYQTAHGIYEFWMNGERGSDRRFAPGNTSYYHRLQYQVDDVTDILTEGENIWGIVLADGWWRGAYGAFGNRNNYGSKVQFLGQLELIYEDGTAEVIGSDETFKCSNGGYIQADMKLGTIYDANLEPEGWKNLPYDDQSWKTVHLGDGEHEDFTALIGEQGEKILEQERFTPEIFLDAENQLVLDFGQNLAGYVDMTLRNMKKGHKIILDHGEGLNQGVFDNNNININENAIDDMFQQVIYTASGKSIEKFCPTFSVFGFRYVKLTFVSEKGELLEVRTDTLNQEDFTAVAVYSNMQTTLTFDSSHQLLNQFMSNTLWSQKGNFMDVPTDCPTRERAPWTGDAQVYCKTAAEFMDVYSFFEKWMQEMNYELANNGQVPSIIPSISFHSEKCKKYMLEQLEKIPEKQSMVGILSGGTIGQPQMLDGCAGWGDAATMVPYNMYLQYGDKTIIEKQYETAKRWVEYMLTEANKENPVYKNDSQYHEYTDGVLDAEYIWDTGFHWGEWSEPNFVHRTLPENFMDDKMKYGEPVVATAYMAYSSGILAKMAKIIDKTEESEHYNKISKKITDIYNRHFVNEDGSIRYAEEGRQAAYVRVLAFHLCERKKRQAVLQRILQMIKEEDYHLNTGFLSTALLLNVLAEEGETEVAYKILEQTTPPSWLYPVVNGMTTNMESWDGVQKYFGSFNHYSFGAAADYMFQYVAGIKIDEKHPGYKHFYLKPLPGGSLKFATMKYESPHGRIVSSWEKKEDRILYTFEIPANTTATIQLPKGTSEKKESGRYEYEEII